MSSTLLFWGPVAFIVIADVVYQVCAKRLSSRSDPLASLGMVYLVGTGVCLFLFALLTPTADLLSEMKYSFWQSVGIGFSVVGIEVGTVYMYRAGWAMNIGFMTYTACIVAALALAGALFYGETLSFRQVLGVLTAIAGMYYMVR